MVEKIAKRTVGFAIISLMVLLVVTPNITTVYSEATEIKYDDGDYEDSFAWETGTMFAVRFTPIFTPFQITEVKYYITDDPTSFNIRIFDSKRASVFVKRVSATSRGWLVEDISASNTIMEAEFYVAIEYITPFKPELGLDLSDPDGRSWFQLYGKWLSAKEFALLFDLPEVDFMIRAVIQPIDSDGDGLYDHEEKTLGTDPNKADTDNDGLNDKIEKDLGTNPLKADTDGDGLNDGDEVNKHKTDPLKVDTDGDGLLDAEEVTKYQTDPLKTDTDGDGLNDKDEILKGTNPLKADSDGDGLNDADELSMKTDPLTADTDGDGLTDSQEVAKGTDPLKADTDGDYLNDSVDPMPTNVFVPDVLGLAVIVAIVIVVFAFRRRKKVTPPLAPVEAPPVPPVPTTKYCVHCGAQMPVDSIYCGKCGQMQ